MRAHVHPAVMPAPFRDRHPRRFAALLLAGLILGGLGLLFLQILVPYLLGPGGLFLIVAFDVSLYLLARRRLRRRPAKRVSRIVWGPVDRRYIRRRKDALEQDVVAGFILAAFVALLFAVGFSLGTYFWWSEQNLGFYVVGAIMTTMAFWVSAGLDAGQGRSESEKYDTTEDH